MSDGMSGESYQLDAEFVQHSSDQRKNPVPSFTKHCKVDDGELTV